MIPKNVATFFAEYINGLNLVDALNLSAENDAFGAADTQAVHYSASIAQLLQDSYNAYSGLDSFDTEQADIVRY